MSTGSYAGTLTIFGQATPRDSAVHVYCVVGALLYPCSDGLSNCFQLLFNVWQYLQACPR